MSRLGRMARRQPRAIWARRHGCGVGRRRRSARALTLAELVISTAILGILLTGVASTVLVASHALPRQQQSATPLLTTSAALTQIDADLIFATRVLEFTSTAITIEVADRGHGAPGPETIRYSWSGVNGAPLTRAYNGVSTTLLDSVSNLTLSGSRAMRSLPQPPRVLLLASSLAIGNSEILARETLLESWGMSVRRESVVSVWPTLDDAMSDADVVYIAAGASDAALGADTLKAMAWGIVTEEDALFSPLSLASATSSQTDDHGYLLSVVHDIIAPLSATPLTISNQDISLHYTDGAVAAGALGMLASASNEPLELYLLAVETGAGLLDSSAAAGRRVTLPWGAPSQFGELNENGRKLLQRALTWAAAEPVMRSVSVSLLTGSEVTNGLEIRVRLVNQPPLDRRATGGVLLLDTTIISLELGLGLL